MSKAKIGDTVETLAECGEYFKEGVRAKLTRIDSDGYCWADFRAVPNPPGSFDDSGDGVWCVGEDNGEEFRVVEVAQ